MKRVGALLARSFIAALLVVALNAQIASADTAPTPSPTVLHPEDPGTAQWPQPQDPGF